MASNKDINDLERFYDTSNDNRTQTQIMWEEGIYKEGSFRKKWADDFGKNGFYKFGKKLYSILCLMVLWSVISIVLPYARADKFLQIASFVLVNAASIWIYRQTCEDRKFTVLNLIYLCICAVVTFVLYRYINFIFIRLGESIFLSLYYVLFQVIPYIAVLALICVRAMALYHMFRFNFTHEDWLFCIIAAAAVLNGFVFMIFGGSNVYLYKASLAVVFITMVLGFCMYIKTRNKELKNISLAFSVLSFMEILGRYAVNTGVMQTYIDSGVF